MAVTETLRVGVNLLWCRPGEVGGSEEYLVRQLVGLAATYPDIRCRLAVPPGFAVAHPDLAEPFDLVTGNTATRFRGARVITESIGLSQLLGDVDVVHHAGGTMPPRANGTGTPAVLTIHDVQYLRFPHYFSPARRAYLRWRVPPSIRRASVLAVPTSFVGRTLVESFDIDPASIVVVPHGFDPPETASLPAEAALRRRFGLGKRRYVIYPAITHPHKGHRFLVDVFARHWAAADPDLALVLLGGAGAAEPAVAEAVARCGVAGRVIRPGRVSAPDRDALIAAADALVFPSEYEGFGAPVLEAMALGTPVVCSDQAALPEVADDAAVVLPLDSATWSGALGVVAATRAELVDRGRRRAGTFTTARSGAAIAGAYRQAATAG